MTEAPEKLTTGEPLGTEDLLKYLPALGEISPGLLKNYALGAAVLRRFDEGDIICEEGEFGSTAFYVVEGNVDIYIANPLAKVQSQRGGGFFGLLRRAIGLGHKPGDRDEHGYITIDADVDLPKTTPLATLGVGELFGEMTCRTFQPRSATVRAKEDCVMIEMLRVILDMLVGTREVDADTKASTKVKAPTFKGTSFKKEMDEKYRRRSLINHLRSVPLFGELGDEFLGYLRDRAELISCSKGQVICQQGDPADAFYLIRSGLVRVSQSMPGGDLVRTYLKRGEFFGEIGLLLSTPRNATCTALDAVDLVKIGATEFMEMISQFPGVKESLSKIAQSRVAANQARQPTAGLQLDDFMNQGLYQAQNLLLIDLDHCTRCDACVNACAEAHDGVTRLIRDGLRYDHFLVPTACRSCRDPLCMTQCPVGSIRRKESLEIIIEDWCIGCTKCAELCPYGNINMHPFEVMKEVPAEQAKPAAASAEKKDAAKAAPAAGAKAAPATKPTPATIPPKTTEAMPPVEVVPKPAANAATAALVEKTVQPPPEPASATPPAAAEPAVAKPAKTAATPAASGTAAAKPATAPAAKKNEPTKKMVRKKMTVQKATTCDLCTDLSVPSCVYACPHDAAKRVEPQTFFASGGKGWSFRKKTRTTH
jgi:CRP-like cAMP-binding protein/Fe-S-cluster-containing hydrogenase component 2